MRGLAKDELDVCQAVLRNEVIRSDDHDLVERLVARGLFALVGPACGAANGVQMNVGAARVAVMATLAARKWQL